MTMFRRDTVLRLCSALMRIDIVVSVSMTVLLLFWLRGH
jgi:hypothetical protein